MIQLMLSICYREIERLFKWFYFYHMHLLRAGRSTQLIEKEVRKKRMCYKGSVPVMSGGGEVVAN